MRDPGRSPGFGSVVVIAVSMLITLVLVVLYLRAFLPTGPKGGPAGGALEAAKRQAQNFEEQQKRHIDDLNRQLAQ